MNDQIQTYVMNVSAGVRKSCPTCGCFKAVWVGETEGGDTLTCCGTCQRVLTRRRTDSIPPLSVNSAQLAAPPAPASPQPAETTRMGTDEPQMDRQRARELYDACKFWPELNQEGMIALLGLRNLVGEWLEPAPASVPPPSEELAAYQAFVAAVRIPATGVQTIANVTNALAELHRKFRASSPAVPPPPTKTEEEQG